MYHKKFTGMEISSNTGFSATISTTRCSKSNDTHSHSAQATCSILAEVYRKHQIRSLAVSHLFFPVTSSPCLHFKMKLEFRAISWFSRTSVLSRTTTFSILSYKKMFLLVFKHSQSHRNNNLLFEIQQNQFREKN